MNDKELEEKVKAMTFWSGKNSMTIEDMAAIQPGLARIMPEIGARTWKLYYAAKLENWPMAKFQYKEIIGLFEMGAFMRPKHEAAIAYHELKEKPYIQWKLPETAPPDLDLRPRGAAKK